MIKSAESSIIVLVELVSCVMILFLCARVQVLCSRSPILRPSCIVSYGIVNWIHIEVS